MNDYQRVGDSLKRGVEPELLCATCPWDRFCIIPPEMDQEEVDRQIEEASHKDEERARLARAEGKDPGMPVGMLLTAVTLGGRARQATLCPVFAIKLKTTEGKAIVEGLKTSMQS